jgi:hypothetical protein
MCALKLTGVVIFVGAVAPVLKGQTFYFPLHGCRRPRQTTKTALCKAALNHVCNSDVTLRRDVEECEGNLARMGEELGDAQAHEEVS